MTKFEPPYSVVPIPVDKLGRGPELDEIKIVKTVFEVWDACNMTVSVHSTPQEAWDACVKLND